MFLPIDPEQLEHVVIKRDALTSLQNMDHIVVSSLNNLNHIMLPFLKAQLYKYQRTYFEACRS